MGKPSAVVTLYLLAYNAFNAVAWGYIAFLAVATIWPGYASGQDWGTTARATWEAVGLPLRVTQTLAVLEIVHAATGIVRSPVGSTITQSLARMWVLWCALVLCPTAREQAGFVLVVLSWSIVEVPRYTFYALNLYNAVPAPIFFLRYHLFVVLYPSGFIGEFLCLYNSLPYLQETGKYAVTMPNDHNLSISLATGMRIMMVLYTIGLFVMYNHMLTMRRRAYAKLKTN